MNLLTITWPGGGNNPFEFFTKCIRQHMQSLGTCCFDIELNDRFASHLLDITRQHRIDVAITFQGMGSNLCNQEQQNIWEWLNIKLLCLHGDHPCHVPNNHVADSSHVLHLYGAPSWALYSEKYFARKRPVQFFMPPQFFQRKQRIERQTSECFFVFPKNLEDTSKLIEEWQSQYPAPLAGFLIMAAQAIMDSYQAGDDIEHHALIDQLLFPEKFAQLCHAIGPSSEPDFFHAIHSMLDRVYRSHASESVLKELKDVPMQIYGIGWDRHKPHASKHHTFKTFDTLSNGEYQYASRYGIVDASPSCDVLHDRSLRALGWGSGFLSNCQLDLANLVGHAQDGLFYGGWPGDLREKAEAVMADPDRHQARAIELGQAYHRSFSMAQFHRNLIHLLS